MSLTEEEIEEIFRKFSDPVVSSSWEGIVVHEEFFLSVARAIEAKVREEYTPKIRGGDKIRIEGKGKVERVHFTVVMAYLEDRNDPVFVHDLELVEEEE